MDKYKALQILLADQYYTIDDLRYNKKLGFMLSKNELNDYLTTKDNLVKEGIEPLVKIPLISTNKKDRFLRRSFIIA